MKIRSIFCFISLLLLVAQHAGAFALSEWLGPEVTGLSATFDRYDMDAKTGKMKGPSKGYLTLQRPDLLMIQTQDQWIKLFGDWMEISPCPGCKTIAVSPDEAFGKALVQLIRYGANPGLFGAVVASNENDKEALNVSSRYSLAPLGFAQLGFTLWSYRDLPTVVELQLVPGTKTIIQLYGVQRQFVTDKPLK